MSELKGEVVLNRHPNRPYTFGICKECGEVMKKTHPNQDYHNTPVKPCKKKVQARRSKAHHDKRHPHKDRCGAMERMMRNYYR